MILEETVNSLIRNTIDDILNISGYAIKSKQNSPRPIGPYADVDFVRESPIGWEEKTYSNRAGDEDLDVIINSSREATISVNFYREGAIDNARKLYIGLSRESVIASFKEAKIGLIRRSDIRELSERLDSTWEERAQIDIFLNLVGDDEDVISSILSADISLKYELEDEIYTTTIEVN